MNIYSSIPAPDLMAARCRRDKIDPSALIEVVAPQSCGRYAIRCLGLPTRKSVFDGTQTNTVPAFILYSLRRDGRVSNGWGFAVEASKMVEIAGVAQ